MAITVKVKVLRHMNGDDGKGGHKAFEPGDFRSLSIVDAERLAETGSVKIVGKPKMDGAPKPAGQQPKARGAKAAVTPRNKAVRTAPANKAK